MNKKKIIKYILLFFLFLGGLLFSFTLNRGDTFANYGFSYAISMGEVPYKDFNMVITPFSPLLYSIGLLFNKSILTFYIEQALLLVFLFFVLEKFLNKKVWLFLLILFIAFPIPFSTVIFPGYNFISFLLLLLIVYLEENDKNDYLIGFLLGLVFLTKQSIGVFLFLPSVYYLFKRRKKFGKRVIGFLIPCLVVLLYILINKAFDQFFDLCFLGLFNFGSGNKTIDIFYLLCFIVGIIYLVFRIMKKKKDISNYYFLCYFIVALPIIDYYHVSLFLLGPIFLFIRDINFKDKYYKIVYSLIFIFYGLGFTMTILYLEKPVISNFHNFPLYIVNKRYAKNVDDLNKYLNKQDKDIVFLLRGSENYMFKIMNNKKITYYDLPNKGNYGYRKDKKIANDILNMHDKIFILDSTLCVKKEKFQQYICEFRENAIKDSILIKAFDNYEVYYRE